MLLFCRVAEKTIFRLTLATAPRVNTLSADQDFLKFRDNGSVWLMTHQAFLAKNLSNLAIQSLPVSGKHDPACLQDLVWVPYMDLSQSRLIQQIQHFLPLMDDGKKVSPQALSSWINTVIKDAYVNLSKQASRLLVCSYDVQVITTSLALHHYTAL